MSTLEGVLTMLAYRIRDLMRMKSRRRQRGSCLKDGSLGGFRVGWNLGPEHWEQDQLLEIQD